MLLKLDLDAVNSILFNRVHVLFLSGQHNTQSKISLELLEQCSLNFALVFHSKILEPRVLPWQQLSMCSVSFVMYISGAKFDSSFYCLNGTAFDVITLLFCIIQKRKYL